MPGTSPTVRSTSPCSRRSTPTAARSSPVRPPQSSMHVTENVWMEPEGDCVPNLSPARASHPQVDRRRGQRATAVASRTDAGSIGHRLLFSDGALLPSTNPTAGGGSPVGSGAGPGRRVHRRACRGSGGARCPMRRTRTTRCCLAHGPSAPTEREAMGCRCDHRLTSAAAMTGWDGRASRHARGDQRRRSAAHRCAPRSTTRTHIDPFLALRIWHVDGGSFR
jgi:hypothetical protein